MRCFMQTLRNRCRKCKIILTLHNYQLILPLGSAYYPQRIIICPQPVISEAHQNDLRPTFLARIA